MKCTPESHADYKMSLHTLALRSLNGLQVWPDRPAPGMLFVSAQCCHCGSTLGLEDVPDEHWVAFSGSPVPAHVQPWDRERDGLAEKLATRMLRLVPALVLALALAGCGDNDDSPCADDELHTYRGCEIQCFEKADCAEGELCWPLVDAIGTPYEIPHSCVVEGEMYP